jgi:hypothetical protein
MHTGLKSQSQNSADAKSRAIDFGVGHKEMIENPEPIEWESLQAGVCRIFNEIGAKGWGRW